MILEEIVDRITGRWAASFKAWLYLTLIGILGTKTRTYALLDITQKESFLLAIAVHLIAAPIYYLFSRTFLRKRFTEHLSLIRVSSAFLIFWLVISTSEILITIYVFHNAAFIGPQLFAPLFPSLFGFIASSYLLAEFDQNRIDIKRLAFARTVLEKTAQQSQDQVIAERSQLILAIQDSVFYQLDALRKQFAAIKGSLRRTEIERLANELEDYSANTIRTLSHDMAKDLSSTTPINRLSFVGSQKIRNFSNSYNPLISFKLSLLVMVLVGGNHVASLSGFPGFLFQIVTTLAIVPILFIGSKITEKYSPRNLYVGFISFLVTIFLSGYVLVITAAAINMSRFQIRNEYPALVFSARNLSAVILASLIVTIINARRKTINELVELNEKLQVDLDWMDNRSRELRKELASILHGPLQGRIAGVAMALRLMAADNESSEEDKNKKLVEIEMLLTSVIEDVQKLFSIEKNQPEASIIIKLIDLRRSWDGLAKVSWFIEPNVFAALPTSSFKLVSEILYEAVSNSVRHGGSTTINISLRIQEDDLSLTVIDNGLGIKKDFSVGAGMRKISESGATYSFIDGLDRGAELTIKMPLNK